jgi:hypothetical protein
MSTESIKNAATAFTRKLLISLVAGLGVGLAIGTTMWVRAVASPSTTPPAAVQLCSNNTSHVVTYSSTGTCPSGTTAIAPLAQQSGVVTLNKQVSVLQTLLKGVTRSTVNGYNTLTFSGMNLQVVNGSGSESTLNGLGNLIVGYADNGSGYVRSGSHNLITGDDGGWSAFGGLLGGYGNTADGQYASVSGGYFNVASSSSNEASVSGGYGNTVTSDFASVSGGNGNLASNQGASVSGGADNTASGLYASVSGGFLNSASGGETASVSGGIGNTASGTDASVSGGQSNTASGTDASVSGGEFNTASGVWDVILGGYNEMIAFDIHCGYFPDSASTSNC